MKAMKRIIALMLVALMMVCICSCGAKKDVVVVGYTIYEPMNYKDADGKLIGFDTELAEAIFGELGYEVMFQEIKWENKYTDLNGKTIDCIWNGFTANTADDDGVKRSDKVDFSYNYMENKQVLVVKKDSTIAKAEDLSGKVVAAEKGSAGESYGASFEGATVKGFTKQTDCLFEINAGTAEVAIVDERLAKNYVGQGDYANLKIVEGMESDIEYYAIGFRKESELTAKVNEQLEKMGQDGSLETLAKKYGVENKAIYDFADQK